MPRGFKLSIYNKNYIYFTHRYELYFSTIIESINKVVLDYHLQLLKLLEVGYL